MVKTGAPIRLTLYGPEDEVRKEYSRMVIPWGILKRAIRMQKDLNQEAVSEADLDAMAGLVVELFGNQFSLQELEEGADIGEITGVLMAVVSRARAVMPQAADPT